MKSKELVCVIVCGVIAFSSVTAFAGDYMNGYEAGVRAAKEDHNGTRQFVGGMALGVFYLGYSLFADAPSPSGWRMDQISEKSDSYQRGFFDGWEKEWSRTRTLNAIGGWSMWIVVYLAIVGAYL